MHTYTHAILGKIEAVPGETINKCIGINLDALRNEVDGYKRVLHELNIDTIELDTKGTFHEKLMMENLAIVCHGIAILPKQINSTAAAYNSKLVHKTLIEAGLTVVEQDPSSPATLCPSDVLFTGREFFVGISEFTNETGASLLAETFPEFPCTPIKMPHLGLNLKRFITVAGNDVLSVCDNEIGQGLIRKIAREASFPYHTLTVPTLEAANCVFANNTLLHKGIEDIGDAAFKVFCDRIDFPRRSLKCTEHGKLQLEPSSCVLLLKLF